MINSSEFFSPTKIQVGEYTFTEIINDLLSFGFKKIFIITENDSFYSNFLSHDLLPFVNKGEIVEVFTDIPLNINKNVIEEIGDIYKKKACDSIIAIGGESVIETSKFLSVAVSKNGKDLTDFSLSNRVSLKERLTKFLIIPTNPEICSALNSFALLSDNKKNSKIVFPSQLLLPNLIVINSKMISIFDSFLIVKSIINILTCLIESYITDHKNVFIYPYIFNSMRLISKNLMESLSNENNKLDFVCASTMAGIVSSNSKPGIITIISYCLKELYNIEKEVSMNILLPVFLEYNINKIGSCIGELLLPLAGEDIYTVTPSNKRGEKFIEYLGYLQRRLFTSVQFPKKLSVIKNFTEIDFKETATLCLKYLYLFYKQEEISFTENDIINILKKAF